MKLFFDYTFYFYALRIALRSVKFYIYLLEIQTLATRKHYKFPTDISFEMFFYSKVLGFLVNVLSMGLYIEHVFGELIQPSVERISTAIWF